MDKMVIKEASILLMCPNCESTDFRHFYYLYERLDKIYDRIIKDTISKCQNCEKADMKLVYVTFLRQSDSKENLEDRYAYEFMWQCNVCQQVWRTGIHIRKREMSNEKVRIWIKEQTGCPNPHCWRKDNFKLISTKMLGVAKSPFHERDLKRKI